MTVSAGTTAQNVIVGQQVSALSVPVVIASDQTVTISGGIAGTATPSDNVANPTTAIVSESFNMLWNAAGSRWVRAPGSVANGALVLPIGNVAPTAGAGTPGATTQVVNSYGMVFDGTNWQFPRATTAGNQFITIGLPEAAANATEDMSLSYQTSNAFFAKASTGAVLRVVANNENASTGWYFALVEKTSAPVNADTIKVAFWIPANATVNIEFMRHLHMATGIAGCVSSTPGTVTLASLTGSLAIGYV